MSYPIKVKRSEDDTAKANKYLAHKAIGGGMSGEGETSGFDRRNQSGRPGLGLGRQGGLGREGGQARASEMRGFTAPSSSNTDQNSQAVQVAQAAQAATPTPTTPTSVSAETVQPTYPTNPSLPTFAKRPQAIGPQPTGFRKRGGRAKK